jgi:hypothetical protein
MADLAADYHYNLQLSDPTSDKDSRTEEINNILNSIKNTLTPTENVNLGKNLNDLKVGMALASASNGKSPGLNGLPYEFWKIMRDWNKNMKKEKKTRPSTPSAC